MGILGWILKGGSRVVEGWLKGGWGVFGEFCQNVHPVFDEITGEVVKKG